MTATGGTACPDLYLRLLKRCLTRDLFPDGAIDKSLTQTLPFDAECRRNGQDWPIAAETMVGLRRLDNVQDCITSVIRDGVAGDLVETGVWRGGCAILMRAVLRALGSEDRLVWVADSFEGLPFPDPEKFPADLGDLHTTFNAYLAVSLDQVRENFRRYELLDDQVQFLPGWFSATLPEAPIKQIGVLRLDGDMYESTHVALTSLYSKLSPGGYVIVDDYNCLPNCRAAVDDFRKAMGITDELIEIDWTGVYWRRSA